ncbi:hypothetical protein L9F63_019438, partial [Diploptera punctata]
PPQPLERWNGIKDALEDVPLAPQPSRIWDRYTLQQLIGENIDQYETGVVGQEDCLYINVYTPNLKADDGNKMPVMISIQGGCYYMGTMSSKMYGPDFLMPHSVVLVTAQYRLGILGFISTGDDVLPGNNGLKDQVMALRWVQRNISKFGGNPSNVTLFGASAGACCVHLHMLSPMSKGLFHRAIAHSGCALNPWALVDPHICRQRTFRLAATLNRGTFETSNILTFLQSIPLCDLIIKAFEIIDEEFTTVTVSSEHTVPNLLFGPTKEVQGSSEEIFLQDEPIEIIKSGIFSQVPFILGLNQCEGSIILQDVSDKWYNNIYENFESVISKYVIGMKTVPHEDVQLIANKLKKFYYQGKKKNDMMNHMLFYGDMLIAYGIHNAAEQHAAVSNTPVYLYKFCHRGELGFHALLFGHDNPLFKEAGHCEDKGYIFYLLHHHCLNLHPVDQELLVKNRMTKLWTNFAKTGNPTPENDPDLCIIWKPVTKSEFCYMNIDKHLTMRTDFFNERIALWKE